MASKYTKLGTEEPDFRMVLIGRTGAGKSASGNTILGRKAFKSELSPSTVTSTCQKEEAEFEGKRLAVVDTPGLFATNKPQEEIKKEILWCISCIAPGPHVFLVVIQPSRFTKEAQETIQTMFGEQAARYMMVLFTHGDDLETDGFTIEEFIRTNRDLRDFIRQCGGRYHVFNNRNQDPSQVRELLEKINTMVQKNGGKFYTSEMLEEAERVIQEKMKKLLKEKLIKAVLAVLGAAVGAAVGIRIEIAVGATAGLMGGPVGACVGLGLAMAAITTAKKKKCVIQ